MTLLEIILFWQRNECCIIVVINFANNKRTNKCISEILYVLPFHLQLSQFGQYVVVVEVKSMTSNFSEP